MNKEEKTYGREYRGGEGRHKNEEILLIESLCLRREELGREKEKGEITARAGNT